ncbi:TetR family transcriptional regulator [Streptomyces sp. NPDC006879]|uniref:TetR family transcriptional regulator n=1 Tax=Streptomyces sp. NPDC006879 TaxID=3364767 RepID=UPI0036934172
MVKQERAERTRKLLIQAAAAEFARHGYAGTSLTRISRAATATVGALTFHFPAKSELAAAVGAVGAGITRMEVARANRAARTPLQAVVDITHALAQLLCEDDTVRATARLSRERDDGRHEWCDAWMPVVRERLEEAAREEWLRSGSDPEVVAVLVGHLVAGLEASATGCGDPIRDGRWSLREQLAEVWELISLGIAVPTPPEPAGSSPSHPEPKTT